MLKGRRSIVFLPTNRKITTIGGFVIREFATRAALEGKNPKIFNQSLFLFMLLFLVNSLRLENLRPKLSGEAKIWKFSTRVCYFYSIITFIYIFFLKNCPGKQKSKNFQPEFVLIYIVILLLNCLRHENLRRKLPGQAKILKFSTRVCVFFFNYYIYIFSFFKNCPGKEKIWSFSSRVCVFFLLNHYIHMYYVYLNILWRQKLKTFQLEFVFFFNISFIYLVY